MISLVDINAVLQTAWQAAAPSDVPTQFPGIPLDATRLTSWFEFWITQTDETPQRSGAHARLDLLIDVHCYARRPEKYHVLTMADTVRTSLSQRSFPLTLSEDFDPKFGLLRIHESVIRDLTRESETEPCLPIQHLVVSLTAHAELWPTPAGEGLETGD